MCVFSVYEHVLSVYVCLCVCIISALVCVCVLCVCIKRSISTELTQDRHKG